MTIENIDLQDIYEFMEKGSVSDAPPEIVQYLALLDKVRGMLDRIDQFSNDEVIIKHLMLVDELSRYKAKKVIDEAREYFYKDTTVSKKAWRNIYAAKAEKMLHFAMLTVKDAKEAIAVIKSIRDLVDIRGLNEPELEQLPDELFLKPMKLYSLDANISEFTSPADRNKLAKFIDELPELTEREKIRIKQEALCLPLTIFPDEQENPRKL
jgi:hypothetical protein